MYALRSNLRLKFIFFDLESDKYLGIVLENSSAIIIANDNHYHI